MGADLEEARRAAPSWEALRERRVLARVNAALAERARRRRVGRWAASGVLAAAAAVGIVWVAWPAPVAHVVHPSAGAPVADDEGGRLTLVDGSEIELEAEARVEVMVQSAREVRIAQHAGEARYAVSHRPERAFIVSAGDVEVHVRGTRFVVRRLEEAVEIEVEQGRVEVTRAATSSMLAAGETLRVPTRDAASPPRSVDNAEVGSPSREATHGTAAPQPAEPAREPAPRRAPREVASMESLLRDADLARRAGRHDDAARALRAAVAAHREDPRAATALFSLGRVERRRGRDAAAAEAFDGAYARDPHAVLAEDALAEAAVSWAAAGRPDRARDAAGRYLALFPSGEYVDRVRGLAD